MRSCRRSSAVRCSSWRSGASPRPSASRYGSSRGPLRRRSEPDRRDRPDADPEVLLAAPDREVVAAAAVVAAEVRRLVPAVAGRLEPLDHVLVVVLQQLGLARELGAVGEREARARASPRARSRRDDRARAAAPRRCRGRAPRASRPGCRRARRGSGSRRRRAAASRPRRAPCRASHGARAPRARARRSSARRARRARRAAASSSASASSTVSGFASTVTSAAGGSPASSRSSSAGPISVGVPPPRKIVSSGAREPRALELELGEHRADVGGVRVLVPRHRHEVAVAAAVRAERDVHVEVAQLTHRRPAATEHRTRRLIHVPTTRPTHMGDPQRAADADPLFDGMREP